MAVVAKIESVLKGEHLENFANFTCRDKLFELAVDTFKSSGIPFSMLEKYQIKIFNDKKNVLKNRLGFTSLNGHELLQACRLVEFPYFDENGETGHYYGYKPIPTIEDRKYLQPKGKPAIPYILPEVWQVKEKTHKPIWISEGIKKCLKLFQYNRFPISLSGVWNFKSGVKSKSGYLCLFEELESFRWNGRTVYLGFDSDLWTNPNVRYALYELAFKLLTKGAIVKIATWKNGKGVDDHLVRQDDPAQALQEIEEAAIGLFNFINTDHHKEIVRALAVTEINDVVVLSRTMKEVSSKLKITKTELGKAIEKYKKPKDLKGNFELETVKTILDFIRIGDAKAQFFKEIKDSLNVPDFVKRYSINTSDIVPIREVEKKKYVYNPLTEASIFKAGLHLIFYGEQLYLYRDGWYQPFKERHFLKLIEWQINEPFQADSKKSKEILAVLKNSLQKENSQAEESQINTSPNLINVKNGILDINTFELRPHTPENIFIYQINASYDPQAKCERFERFLKEVLVKEEGLTPDKDLIRVVQQFIGYILYVGGIPFHKCLMLYGRGRNGKSSLVFVISKLLRGLFSSVHFEEIGIDKFATSDLVGKLLNISSELSATAKLQDGDVKKIISGDTLRAQRKFQPAFDFQPFAKHMICTNNLPRSRDKSLGYFARFMVVPFHRTFLSQEEYDNIEDEETKKFCAVQDEFLESKLKKELDGVFLWAVLGLKDLLTNQGFCVPEQVQKLKKIFELRSTSVENFFEDIVDDSDCTKDTELQILYRAYIGFCKDYKIPPETYKKFPSSVRELGYEVGPGSGNVTIVKGVCLKE